MKVKVVVNVENAYCNAKDVAEALDMMNYFESVRALDEYEREPDSTYIFYNDLDEISRSIRALRSAISLADYYHSQRKYSKAIDVLERALDSTFSDPFLYV